MLEIDLLAEQTKKWRPYRESTPGYPREREVSYPLDHRVVEGGYCIDVREHVTKKSKSNSCQEA